MAAAQHAAIGAKICTNSMFRLFAFESSRLVAAGRALADGRDCAYLCDIAVVPGKETFYEGFGFRRMTTAMAIFEDPTKAYANGYLDRA